MISFKHALLATCLVPALAVGGAAMAEPGKASEGSGEIPRSMFSDRALSPEMRAAPARQFDPEEVSRDPMLDPERLERNFGTMSRTRAGEETTEPPGEELLRGLREERSMDTTTDPAFAEEETERAVIGEDERVRVNDTQRYPFSTVGILEVILPDGDYFHCSAALIGPRTVLTAASCLTDPEFGWFEDYAFAPAVNGYDDVPFGVFDWASVHVLAGYVNEWDGNYASVIGHDLGIVILDEPVGDYMGWLGVEVIDGDRAFNANILGYPQDLPPEGSMWRSNCTVNAADITETLVLHTCSTGWGSVGSPVYVYDPGEDERSIRAVNLAETPTANFSVRITQSNFDWIVQNWQ